MLSAFLLIISVIGVGILHTLVPDHWLPIAVLARQRGWTATETARAAAQAGLGHVATTLVLGLLAWGVGAAAAKSYGQAVDVAASLALIGFGLWIAWGAWTESKGSAHGHPHHHHCSAGQHRHDSAAATDHAWEHDALYKPLASAAVSSRHVHWHSHGRGPTHRHWHDHEVATGHVLAVDSAAVAPLPFHAHGTSGRTGLLLVLGSSPMVEGIPAFFAASHYGAGIIALMALAFGLSTIATYVALSVFSASRLQRISLGPLDQYGEVASGLLMAAIGVVFGLIVAF